MRAGSIHFESCATMVSANLFNISGAENHIAILCLEKALYRRFSHPIALEKPVTDRALRLFPFASIVRRTGNLWSVRAAGSSVQSAKLTKPSCRCRPRSATTVLPGLLLCQLFGRASYLNSPATRDMVASAIMLAILLALSASLCFAVSMVLINRGVLAIDYFRGLLTNLGVNALFLWLYVFLFVDRIGLWRPANLIFVLVGIFVPGVARFFIFKGMERLGASITSCLTNATPLFATLFAVSFLHERPTVTNLLGTFLIVLGIVSLSWKGITKTWQTRDLWFPLTAAFLFAARDNMVRLGLLRIDSPIVGAAIAATTSFLTMSMIYLVFEEKKPLSPLVRQGLALFSIAGFMNFLSYVFAYTALSLERVSLMSPLINGSSLFILPLSALFLKDVEKITARIIGATLLVLFGVFLISWEKL